MKLSAQLASVKQWVFDAWETMGAGEVRFDEPIKDDDSNETKVTPKSPEL